MIKMMGNNGGQGTEKRVFLDEESRGEKIRRRIKNYFNFFSGHLKTEIVPRTDRENQIIRRRFCGAVIIFVLVGLACWGIISFYNGIMQISGDIMSLSDKYSSIISLFSTIIVACVTILATYFIVHHNKKVDYHQERIKHMPFLEISLNEGAIIPTRKEIESQEAHKYINLTIANIGYGMAINVLEVGDDMEILDINNLSTGSSKEFVFDCDWLVLEKNYRLMFEDIFENRYIQTYIIYLRGDKLYIQCKPPELIRRTRRFRYIQ